MLLFKGRKHWCIVKHGIVKHRVQHYYMFKINWPLKASTPTRNDVTSDPFLNTLNIPKIELQYTIRSKTCTFKFIYIYIFFSLKIKEKFDIVILQDFFFFFKQREIYFLQIFYDWFVTYFQKNFPLLTQNQNQNY